MKYQEKHKALEQSRENIKHYQQETNAKIKARQEGLRIANPFNEELKQLINTELQSFAKLQRIQTGMDMNKYIHVKQWVQIQANEIEIQTFIRSKYRCCCSIDEMDDWLLEKYLYFGECSTIICLLSPCCLTWKLCVCCADIWDDCLCEWCCKCSCNTHQYSYYCCLCSDCCMAEEIRKWKQLLAIYKRHSSLIQNP